MNGVIQNRERKVVTRSIHIGSVDQAFDVLAAYYNEPAGGVARAIGCDSLVEARVAAYAAACKVRDYLAGVVDPTVAERLSVSLRTAGPAEPTWVSADGTCHYVRDLATAHLVNIMRKFQGSRAGIFAAIRSELDSRKVD